MHQISRRKFVALTATGVAAAPLALMARSIGGTVTAQADRRSHQEEHWRRVEAGDGRHIQGRRPLDRRDRHRHHGARVVGRTRARGQGGRESDRHLRADVLRKGRHADTSGQTLRPRAGARPAPPPPPPPDPVFSAKDAFIKKHNLVVWRFSDHWRLRTPDPFAQGLANVLGWSKFADAE